MFGRSGSTSLSMLPIRVMSSFLSPLFTAQIFIKSKSQSTISFPQASYQIIYFIVKSKVLKQESIQKTSKQEHVSLPIYPLSHSYKLFATDSASACMCIHILKTKNFEIKLQFYKCLRVGWHTLR